MKIAVSQTQEMCILENAWSIIGDGGDVFFVKLFLITRKVPNSAKLSYS